MFFDNISFLWGLGAIPVMAVLLYISWRAYSRFENSKLIEVFHHMSSRPKRFSRCLFGILKVFSFAIIIFALAEPGINLPTQENKYDNVRILFVVDVSNSMVYAEDVKPNRMVATKNEMLDFYKKLDGLYQIGIFPFAGTPNPYYCPPTHYKNTYTLMTKKLGPNAAPTLGTDLPMAIEVLHKYIKTHELDKSGVNIIVVMTDGGKEEAMSTNRLALTKDIHELSNKNCKFFFVGIGSKAGTSLLYRNDKGEFIDYIRDDSKNVAKSQLDEEFIMELAERSNGVYKLFEKPGELHPVLWDTIEKNRVAIEGELVYKRVLLQPYLFALSFVILCLCFIANRRLNVKRSRPRNY